MSEIGEVRSAFRARLLSSCSSHEAREYIAQLESAVANSPLGLSPGRAWFRPPHIDTLLAFYGDKLVAGLVVRSIGMLDPLVVTGDLGPLPARFLDHLRQRAEGVLTGRDHDEYLFHVGEEAPQSWLELIVRMGGMEALDQQGIRTFRRKL